MTKNIKVTDNDGNELGYTFPKRAKGLIKNGRAQYVDDCTIRLSKVTPELKSEAEQMKYIKLNPRDWSEGHSAEHTFIDGFEGKLEEIIQIGTWNTEGYAESRHYMLEAGGEYSLVFWLNGGENENADEICDLLIMFNGENGYKNRYKLNRNYIKPRLHHKGWELYVIPFDTPESADVVDVNFGFRASKAPMAVKAAKEPEYYEGWEDEIDEFIGKRPQRHNIVFEDGWPSLHMYGGNKYSTEILRRNTISKSMGINTGVKVSILEDLEDINEKIDENQNDHELLVDTFSSMQENYSDLLDRCVDNSWMDIRDEIVSEISNDLTETGDKLAKLKVNEYADRLLNATTKEDVRKLEYELDDVRDELDELEEMLDELESKIDDYSDRLDELEDEQED